MITLKTVQLEVMKKIVNFVKSKSLDVHRVINVYLTNGVVINTMIVQMNQMSLIVTTMMITFRPVALQSMYNFKIINNLNII